MNTPQIWSGPDKFKRGAVSDHYSAVVLADQLKDAIIWLEGVFTNDNRGRKIALPNVILSPLLASYYKYCKDADKLAKVEEFIYKVTNDRTNHDPEDGKFNAVTLFLDGWKARKNDNPPDWLGGCILKANYQSEITEGFVLLHVDKYVKVSATNVKHIQTIVKTRDLIEIIGKNLCERMRKPLRV